MNVIGLNGVPLMGHDPAACLVTNGKVVAAVEEERLNRVKRSQGLPPTLALQEVMQIGGVQPEDVNVICLPWLPRAMGYDYKQHLEQVKQWLAENGFHSQAEGLVIRFVEHYEAHAWSGLVFSRRPLAGRKIGVLTLDGSGESTSGAAFLFDGCLRKLWNLDQISSLGIYYEALTQFLGFSWGEEGKSMGLASYGRIADLPIPTLPDKRFSGDIPDWVSLQSPKHKHESIRRVFLDSFAKMTGNRYFTFNEKGDLALAVQTYAKNRILEYLKEFPQDIDGIVFAGGIALNCAINAEIAAYCAQRAIELIIPPPASDTGVALGAAVSAASVVNTIECISHPFLGRSYEPEQIASEIRSNGANVIPIDIGQLAELLDKKNLLCGWFEGKSEIGPRALGKRSLIARPDQISVRDRINFAKGRESWRPLAPSLTEGQFHASFEGSTPSPYMLINAKAIDQSCDRLKGVIHVDGTSRPQVVDHGTPYHSLLKAIGSRFNVEALICTSFNRAGEPIVYSPVDAIESARAMRLDALAGDGWMVDLSLK